MFIFKLILCTGLEEVTRRFVDNLVTRADLCDVTKVGPARVQNGNGTPSGPLDCGNGQRKKRGKWAQNLDTTKLTI